MMIIVIVVIGLALYFGFNGKDKVADFQKNDPMEMLKERFAKGEIDEQTYLQMKETLKR